jgi:hypothetical protein
MKIRNLLGILLISITLTSAISSILATDTLRASDFTQESWAKTVDFYDYARAYATLHGMTSPPANYHAYLYMTYLNTMGMQMLYAGLNNITFGGGAYFTIPMQTFMIHYKTANNSRDIIMASTFLMLLAFNETTTSTYANSPDINDNLWASFSMGFDLTALNATLPILNSKTETIPLTHSDDKLQWSWGMKYTNLTAFWWRTYISPTNPHFESAWPVAITVYDELTFTYNLTINPDTHTATLIENHTIGRMRQLLLFAGIFWINYNSTGTYWLGNKISNDTIYDFIQNNQIKMSIVNFQTSIMLDHNTYSESASGENVTDADKIVSDSSITTYADDGEKIFDVAFGAKETYKLYNYTAYPSENVPDTYNATTRTCKINGFASNTGLFTYQIGLMTFLPLLVANMHPQLYQKAKESISNMSHANYFYLIAYPIYSGYKVEHDPTFTIYLTTSASTTPAPNWGGIFILGVVVGSIIVAVAALLHRRKPKQQPPLPAPPEPQTTMQSPTS